ncbi:hypothetical protein RND81_12G221500 [Saponaria officinalis]|uniref:Uncharacterized protein n=1 Tax=Saponaria officinalis TaxID=3572 RepID=A0AAW1HE16_SAPOF
MIKIRDVCGGMWDVVYFIEHICILDLIRFLLACCICYICLVFLYLLFKLGLCQCLARSFCKMCWAACETYWFTLEYVCCYCWRKIRHTKRVYRGRQRIRRQLSRDIELGYISSSPSGVEDFYDAFDSNLDVIRKSYLGRGNGRGRRRRRFQGNSVRLRRGKLLGRLNGRSRRGRRRDRSKHFHSRRCLDRT